MKSNFKKWFICAGIRAIKTVAETAAASIGVAATMGEVDWIYILSSSALAGVISLLISVKGLPEVKYE